MKPTFVILLLLTLTLLWAACERGDPPEASERPEPSPEVLALGEDIFQRTAGGTGCQACHGMDASGSRAAPNITRASEDSIRRSLNRVPQMRHITLDDREIEAVAAYIRTLR
jgi:mono/diheme cytochrome c family protein